MRAMLERLIAGLREDPEVLLCQAFIGPQAPDLLTRDPFDDQRLWVKVDTAHVRADFAQANGCAISWAHRRGASPALRDQARQLEQQGPRWPDFDHPEDINALDYIGSP